MSWFADLAGKAESLLNNLDEQTGAALRNHAVKPKKQDYGIHSDPPWTQRRRPRERTFKKQLSADRESRSHSPRKPSPTNLIQSPRNSVDFEGDKSPKRKRSPKRSRTVYNLNNCPKTLVDDIPDSDILVDHNYGIRYRRSSLPADLEVVSTEDIIYKMQNFEVENTMLKNELNVMNREVTDLLDRLHKTEDGNIVDNRQKELHSTKTKLENSEYLNNNVKSEKISLRVQLEQLKFKVNELATVEMRKYQEQNQKLEVEIDILRDRNIELEDRIKQLMDISTEKDFLHTKLETDYRHLQSTVSDLQMDLDRTTTECRRLEQDWEAYKLRVKGMLHSRDMKIQALQEGIHVQEDTGMLIEQLDKLREERDDLSEGIARVRSECDETKHYIEQLESKHRAAERVVNALREALRDERAARTSAETQCHAISKDLKTLQIETSQIIANLSKSLSDKENELDQLRSTASSMGSTDTSALNVAVADAQNYIDSEKIKYLTQTLVQRQGKIDSLLSDNNMLKIQMEKLESKYKAEITSLRAKQNHSIVQLHEDKRFRAHAHDSALTKVSLRIGGIMRRYPIVRIFIIFYMLGLHFWVVTVLLTNTPEEFIKNPLKS